MKTIYYYQSFCGLDKLYSHVQDIDTIILSSIHFSKYKNEPYIHLNDYPPSSPIFDSVWIELQKLYETLIQRQYAGASAAGGGGNLNKDEAELLRQIEEKLANEKSLSNTE